MNKILNIPQNLKNEIKAAVKQLYDRDFDDFDVLVPGDVKWGDYSTNVGLKLAGEIKQSPVEIAKKIAYRLERVYEEEDRGLKFTSIEVAGKGYINFRISGGWLKDLLIYISQNPLNYREMPDSLKMDLLRGKNIMVEYTDPNPFKVFHLGHLMPNAIGESFSRLFEFCGANVKRASYQGDAGMHVAKSIWGMERLLDEEGRSLEEVSSLGVRERVEFLGRCYALGATAYQDSDEARAQIKDYNYLVYLSAQERLQEEEGWEPQVDYAQYVEGFGGSNLDGKGLNDNGNDGLYERVKKLYVEGRKWSLDYFETVYDLLGTDFDFYYFESVTGEYGYKIVMDFLSGKSSREGVFDKDQGAVIFRGEELGLHTRVFINSQGLPTYEAKDLGLAFKKAEDFDYDLSYIVTGNEIDAYFQVVLAALGQISPELAAKTRHVSHGMMTLTEGKMSSRTGEVISVDDLISELVERVEVFSDAGDDGGGLGDAGGARGGGGLGDRIGGARGAGGAVRTSREDAEKIAVAAVKYAILRQQVGKDVVYDKDKSLELTGNTGPYLQYAYVRALSVLEKAGVLGGAMSWEETSWEGFESSLCDEEKPGPSLLLRHLVHFNEEVLKSAAQLMPSYLCTYLHELASIFNTFYAQVPILEAETPEERDFRLCLVNAVGVVLRVGLDLLGIEVVERM